MRRLGLIVVTVVIVANCGKGTRRREDAEVSRPQIETRWIDTLQGAAGVVAADGALFAEWPAFDVEDPAPRLIEVLDANKGSLVSRERGWLLRAGEPKAALVVHETDTALSYVVRRLDRSGEVALGTPDGSTWPLRGVACSARVELCAVVRWSAPAGQKVGKGGVERISIAVVNAHTLAIERTIEHNAASYFAGSGRVGGVAANPTRPEVYLLERGAAPDELKVRAVDLATGKTAWHAAVAALPQAPVPQDDAELIVSGDGQHVAVAQGNARWSYLELERLTMLTAATGVVEYTLSEPSGYGFVVAVPHRPSLLAVRVGVTRPSGETPDYAFLGVVQLDPTTGRSKELIGRRDGDVPQGGVALDERVLVLYRRGLRQPYVEDTTPPDRRKAMAAAVGAMLER